MDDNPNPNLKGIKPEVAEILAFLRDKIVPAIHSAKKDRDVFADSIEKFSSLFTKTDAQYLRMEATAEAMISVAKELAVRSGLSADAFDEQMDRRVKHFLQKRLEGVEEKSPGYAAELDRRNPEDIDTSDGFPPLFPDAK